MAKLNQKVVRKVPRGDKRRLELAAIAERTFLKHGFSDTTMLMIALAAGSSKETLYRHFSSKEALFAELIQAKAEAIAGPLSPLAGDAAPDQALFELGVSLMALVTGEATSLLRIVVAEAHRAPDLARILYRHGPAGILERLTAYLAAATSRGALNCEDPEQAAKLFLGAVISHHHLRGLIGQPAKPLTATEVQRHVRAAVEMFLSHFAARR
jgi:AcrR family transcriptional regulator